jgi:hypothetical protein
MEEPTSELFSINSSFFPERTFIANQSASRVCEASGTLVGASGADFLR